MRCIDTLNEKLTALASTPSTNDKLAIVKSFDEQELRVVQLTLDTTIDFYIKKLPEITHAGSKVWDADTGMLLHKLATRKLTGNDAREAVDCELRELVPEHRNVLRKVILKDLGCGVGATLVNKAFPGTLPVFPYMRCSLPDKSNFHKWGPEVWAAGVYSDLKADGMFANLSTSEDGVVTILSRQGSKFPDGSLPRLQASHAPLKGYRLDGELLVTEQGAVLERQIGNGILNSLLSGGDLDPKYNVVYMAWDVVPLSVAKPKGKSETPLRVRRELLNVMVRNLPAIDVIEYEVVHSKEAAYAHYKRVLARGLEGTVAKSPEALWMDGDSKDQVKLKLEVPVELQVVGTVDGKATGKNAEMFGSLRCASADNLLEVDVSGFTDKVRSDLWARHQVGQLLGTVITVKANGLMEPSPSNDKHSLFLPRFVEERKDKDVADTLEGIREQFAAAVA